ncbi:ATP synthase inhibitor protein INH1 [Phycomyces blakesleeanus]|uniref:ATPase inhibitor, mitochondrial n=2 Tax=Phycomyces blakesleeanus TaxID=4837 RepID=A0A167R0E3_PHYB8|nr:ATP synthase inhibitor protein INH1 [Phycomyces blakesleeanus NRRL 1555(-)]OAD80557.1 ATP synthase inhibitor protein INH1 [Phycomyces blakesleeanus NRRL 1555(-)]|eukprot:XP_018298597.1 ATP synthase inhibitor protein INH1 [Phycomyces blakesleeanus NRRL 1555(-)]
MLKLVSRITTRSNTHSVICLSGRYSSSIAGADGATASSKGAFGEKEKALENQWARAHDAEKIKMLREALKKQQEHSEELQKDIDALKKSSKK